jgi:hypothetical protein
MLLGVVSDEFICGRDITKQTEFGSVNVGCIDGTFERVSRKRSCLTD